MAIQDSDVTVELTPNLDDTVSSQVDAREKKLLMGTTVHYRQAQPYLSSALLIQY